MTILCLNLLSREAIYCLALRPLVGPLRAPEITVSYQQIPMNIFEGWCVSTSSKPFNLGADLDPGISLTEFLPLRERTIIVADLQRL